MVAALAAMVAVPLIESAGRSWFGFGIPGAAPIVQHLTLWIAFLGAALAAREGKLLALATGDLMPAGRGKEVAGVVSGAVGAGVCLLLFRAGLDLVIIEWQAGTRVAGLFPVWLAQLVMPLAFATIAWRLIYRASPRWPGRLIAVAGGLVGLWLGQFPQLLDGRPVVPGLLVILAATLLGGPIFVALGGAAVLLFMAEGVPPAAVPAESYRLSVSATLPAIPLFTLTGFILAEGKASQRLLRLFHALFGWIPGGTAVVTAMLCAFFTVFTGGSGVTILALGGLLFKALQEDGYRERFSLGMLTASGSLGLLFPPALPLILYGIVAQISIPDLFLGGLLPGLLLVGLIAAWGVREGLHSKAGRQPFDLHEAREAIWEAKWEAMLPALVLVAIFGGFATLVEAAALTALYAIVIQCFVHRDVAFFGDLPRVFRSSAVLIGGVLIILGVAMGLTGYLVDAQVPAKIARVGPAVRSSSKPRLPSLPQRLPVARRLSDGHLLRHRRCRATVGAPRAEAFGVHPIHLGIIFIANLELGYLTPPVGPQSLFLASYRFERPLVVVYRAALPMLLLMGIGVLLITYIPGLSLWLVGIFGGR